MPIDVNILKIDSGCPFEKEFTKLIPINSEMILYLIINQFDLSHSCLSDH